MELFNLGNQSIDSVGNLLGRFSIFAAVAPDIPRFVGVETVRGAELSDLGGFETFILTTVNSSEWLLSFLSLGLTHNPTLPNFQ